MTGFSVRLLLLSACLSVQSALASDQIPGAPQKKPVALVNGVLHTVSGPVIEAGTIVFDNGRITELGPRMQPPPNADVIDLQGRHVYPGMIESHSQLGLTELSSTRATIDTSEVGLLNPNVTAATAVNPDSELIPVTRANGVLVALSAPSGGLVSGKASLLQLDGWTSVDMTLQRESGLVINWPASFRSSFFGPPSAGGAGGEAGGSQVQELRNLFTDARAWSKARTASPETQRYDIRFASMQSVLAGKVPLIVAADEAEEIQAAVAFGVEQKLQVIIFGGYDAESCAELLRRYQVPVIVSAVHRDPRNDHDDYDAAYTLPERLRKAGIRFCISGSARSETWNTRNLPYQAATAAAYGLPRDEALKSVTLYPAQILGVADRLGSLEPGRDATIFVSTGDPLETDSQVTQAWIQGRVVDLNSRHTQLAGKYGEKFRRLNEGR
ncbi:MAG: amidohydrolase family protein [Planctomyces sp.]|jgi:imidazolonepropionase-like amidohydrolase|nr:imidazolonepropionase [Planctomycetia bacterium]HAV30921.1 imidazolonepropionase [Planctomycetaceae bacterium]